MKHLITGVVAVALMGAAGVANASEALAKANGCLSCHAVGSKKVGPSLKSVAADWKKGGVTADKAVAATKAKHDSVKANDEDLKAISAWILTL